MELNSGLRIGYDAKRLFNNFTGLGNYSRDLIRNMSTYYPDNSYLLYSPHISPEGMKRYRETITDDANSDIRLCTPKSGYKYFPSLWRTKGVVNDLKHDNIDLYHGLSHELPRGINHTKIKTVVTIHDVIYLRYPHLFPYIDRKIYDNKFRHACKIADKVVAISECTKRDIVSYFGTNPDKIEVIYQNCSEIFRDKASEEQKAPIKKKYNLPNEYILYVGSVEERKNVLLLVEALKKMKEAIPIVVVGKQTPYINKVNSFVSQNNLTDKVHILHSVSFLDLPVLYQMAQLFVYPSRYEGFGLPIVEALTSGIPVIAATGSCLEEAGGEDSAYINPDDSDQLATTIINILSSPTLQQQMIKRGFQHIEQFSNQHISQSMMNLYKSVLA